jgi:hypothetical protein
MFGVDLVSTEYFQSFFLSNTFSFLIGNNIVPFSRQAAVVA